MTMPWSNPFVAACAFVCALSMLACESDDAVAADGGSVRIDASSAGTSGRAGDAGSAGADGGGSTGDRDAAMIDASDALDDDGGEPLCQPCIGKTIGWGPNGGHVATLEHSELTSCNAYRHTRTPSGDPEQVLLTCERPLPCMGSGLHGISDVLQAMEHADVVAARAKGNVLYGSDPRLFDGQVLRIELPDSVIDVGNDCTGGGECVAIPAGVATLADLLRSIDSEQLAIEPCLSTFE